MCAQSCANGTPDARPLNVPPALAALAAKNAKPLSGTAYKLKLLEQEIVDLVQSLTQ